jgi:phosphoglycerate dehydrogenase-like enzyme
VCSARQALATGVAEFAFGMMLVSMKAVWRFREATSRGVWDRDGAMAWVREPYEATIGIVGAGAVGRAMIRLCATLTLDAVLLYDPYVTPEQAGAIGAEKVDLDDLMRRSDVVSLHTPATEECRHLINARNLPLLKDHAIFINTARGMCVDEAALIAELQTGRILACLDVTDPEPPPPGSPLYSLPNCILTPHIAGAVKENTFRQGRQVANQIEDYVRGEPVPGEIDLTQHHRLA